MKLRNQTLLPKDKSLIIRVGVAYIHIKEENICNIICTDSCVTIKNCVELPYPHPLHSLSTCQAVNLHLPALNGLQIWNSVAATALGFLNVKRRMTPLRILVKMQLLIHWVWRGAPDAAFLTSSQMMPVLLVHSEYRLRTDQLWPGTSYLTARSRQAAVGGVRMITGSLRWDLGVLPHNK